MASKRKWPALGTVNTVKLTSGVKIGKRFYHSGDTLQLSKSTTRRLLYSGKAELLTMEWPDGGGLHEFGAPVINQFEES